LAQGRAENWCAWILYDKRMFVFSLVTVIAARVAFSGSELIDGMHSAISDAEVVLDDLIGRHVQVKADGSLSVPEPVKLAEEAAPVAKEGDVALDAWTKELEQKFPAPKDEAKSVGDEFMREAAQITKSIKPKTIALVEASQEQVVIPEEVQQVEDPMKLADEWTQKLSAKFGKKEEPAKPAVLVQQTATTKPTVEAKMASGDVIADQWTQTMKEEFPPIAPAPKVAAPVVALREESPTDIANDWTNKIETKFGKDDPDAYSAAKMLNNNLYTERAKIHEHERLFDSIIDPSSLVEEKEIPASAEKLRSVLAQDSAEVLTEAKAAESQFAKHASILMTMIEGNQRTCFTLFGIALFFAGFTWRTHVNKREDATVKIQALYRGSHQRGMMNSEYVNVD